MDDPRFFELCALVIPATVRSCFTNHLEGSPEAKETAERWLKMDPGYPEIEEVGRWAQDHDCDSACKIVDLLVDIGSAEALEWTRGFTLADELGWEGFESSLLFLLRWMRDATEGGAALGAISAIVRSSRGSIFDQLPLENPEMEGALALFR